MSGQQKMDQERAAFEHDYQVARSVDFDGSRYVPRHKSAWQIQACDYLNDCWSAWQARASLPVGVPDGWALVPVEPTPEMVSAAAGAITTPGDLPPVGDGWSMSDLAFRSRYRAALATAPAAQPAAEQSAPGEVEEVEVVGWSSHREGRWSSWMHPTKEAAQTHDRTAKSGKPMGATIEPLMTVAQHKRIVAQLAARDAGEVRVSESFARFLLGETEIDGVAFGERHPKLTGAFWWRDQLRALLAQRERGVQS